MSRPGRAFLVFIVTAAVFAAASCSQPGPRFRATDVSMMGWGGDFELTAHTGERVKASDFKGKVVLVFFGFTRCPDICPPTMAKLAMLKKRLGAQGAKMQVLFITVDPEFDTAERLAGFVSQFDPSFIGLTGSEAEIAAVAREYKVGYSEESDTTSVRTAFIHSGNVMVKDATGKLRLLIKSGATIDDMEHDVRLLLDEKR